MGGTRLTRTLYMALLLLFASSLQAAPITVLVEPYPPFVLEQGGHIVGPYVEAFQQLAQQRGIQSNIEAMPIRRALLLAEKAPGVCVLGLNYSASDAEVLLYLGRIAPIYVWAFARHGENIQASSVQDLKRYQLGIVDMAEIRRMLDENGVHYDTLQVNSRGLQMLEAHRFDVLISDIGPELAASKSGASLDRLFTVNRVERWVACNPSTDSATVGALRASMKEGVFAENVRGVWEKYGLGDYFTQVRKEWSATTKP